MSIFMHLSSCFVCSNFMCHMVLSSSAGKESACNEGDPSLIPGLGSSPREGIGYPCWYSWASLVAQMVKNPPAVWETWVCLIPGCEDPLEKERLPTPVFLPGESHEWRSLVDYSPLGHKESGMTEQLPLSLFKRA